MAQVARRSFLKGLVASVVLVTTALLQPRLLAPLTSRLPAGSAPGFVFLLSGGPVDRWEDPDGSIVDGHVGPPAGRYEVCRALPGGSIEYSGVIVDDLYSDRSREVIRGTFGGWDPRPVGPLVESA